MVVWITGLSSSGKTTIAKEVFEILKQKFDNTILLDGDIIREALNSSYGYTYQERLKGAWQVSGLCKMLDKQGINVVCSTMSLFSEIHKSNKQDIREYFEIFLDVPMDVLKQRDTKGLYNGKIKDVVGIDVDYDKPTSPKLTLDNSKIEFLKPNIQKIIDNVLAFTRYSSSSKEFWENYYVSNKVPVKESSFARFVLDYIEDKEASFLELGCGNARDSLYFSKNFKNLSVEAIDQCQNEIKFLNANYASKNLCFSVKDFTNMVYFEKSYDYIYSRFTLHAINEDAENRVLAWIEKSLKDFGKVFFEFRSIKDEMLDEGIKLSKNENYTTHYRRFIGFEEFKQKLKKFNLKIEYEIESDNLAKYKDDNPVVIRIVASK